MSNSSCAAPSDLARLASVNFVVSQLVDLTAILITFGSTYFAVNVVLKRSIFQLSTKILLLQNLFYANLHQLSYGIEAVGLLYRHAFLMDEPCKILQSEAHCAPYLEVLLCGISGMIYGQTGLMIDRAFATFSESYSKRKSLWVACSIFVAILAGSASTGRLLLWDDPVEKFIFGCFVFPSQSSARSIRYFMVCTFLTLFNLATSLLIMRYNKRFEYATRFKVGERFRKREAIESTKTICFLICFQFIGMFIYYFGIMLLARLKDVLVVSTFYFWIVWCYVSFSKLCIAFATFYKNYSTFVSRLTGIVVSSVVLVCSALTFRLILWDDPLDGHILSCFIPPEHSSTRINLFLSVCVLLTLFNLITSISVMYYNKRLEFE
ncbi:unnamed protein product [Caenorhabditis sp. 36 PRJEB53466]|nr:unnamed protein product [Caenorhabditis sp. 36 PRJEB53466]